MIPSGKQILVACFDVYGVDSNFLAGRRFSSTSIKGKARDMAAFLCRRHTSMGYNEIAKTLKMLSNYSAQNAYKRWVEYREGASKVIALKAEQEAMEKLGIME